MSALPPKADIGTQPHNVRFVPKADVSRCSIRYTKPAYSITSSARPRMVNGTLTPSALAAFRLMISSTFVAC